MTLLGLSCSMRVCSVTSNSLQPRGLYSLPGPLSMGWSWQEYWSRLPFPLPGIFLTQGSNLHLLHWQVNSLPRHHLGSSLVAAPGLSSCTESLLVAHGLSRLSTCRSLTSPTLDWIHILCTGRWILNHRSLRKVTSMTLLTKHIISNRKKPLVTEHLLCVRHWAMCITDYFPI